MLVGHTPQRAGINSAADGQVWRVDTGMTAMIGGRPEVRDVSRPLTISSIIGRYRHIPPRLPTPIASREMCHATHDVPLLQQC